MCALLDIIRLARRHQLVWIEDPMAPHNEGEADSVDVVVALERGDEARLLSTALIPDPRASWFAALRLCPTVENLPSGEVLFPTADHTLIVTSATTKRVGPPVSEQWNYVRTCGCMALYTEHPDVPAADTIQWTHPRRLITANSTLATGLSAPFIAEGGRMTSFEGMDLYGSGKWMVAVVGDPSSRRTVLVPHVWRATAASYFLDYPTRDPRNFIAAVKAVNIVARRVASAVDTQVVTDGVLGAVMAAYQESIPAESMLVGALWYERTSFNAMLQGARPCWLPWWLATVLTTVLVALMIFVAAYAFTGTTEWDEWTGPTTAPTPAPTPTPLNGTTTAAGWVHHVSNPRFAWIWAEMILVPLILVCIPALAARKGRALIDTPPTIHAADCTGHEPRIGDKVYDIPSQAPKTFIADPAFKVTLSIKSSAPMHTAKRQSHQLTRTGAAHVQRPGVFRCDASGAVAAFVRFLEATPDADFDAPAVLKAMNALAAEFRTDAAELLPDPGELTARPTNEEVDECIAIYAESHGRNKAEKLRKRWYERGARAWPLGAEVQPTDECIRQNESMPKLELGHKRLRNIECPDGVILVIMMIVERRLRRVVKEYFTGQFGANQPLLRRWYWGAGRTRTELAALGPWVYGKGGARWVSYDFARWDGSVRAEFLQWLYTLFPTSPELVAFLTATIERDIRASLGMYTYLRAHVKGKVTTGSAWTTFGNTLIHIFAVSAAVRDLGLEEHFLGGVAGGDDGANIWSPAAPHDAVSRLQTHLLKRFGLKQDPIEARGGPHADYYSCWWVPADDPCGYAFVPKCARDRIKDGWAVDVKPGDEDGRYMAKTLSAEAANRGCPFCDPVLKHRLAALRREKINPSVTIHDNEPHKPLSDAQSKPNADGAAAFLLRYGCPADWLLPFAVLAGPRGNLPDMSHMLAVDYGSEYALNITEPTSEFITPHPADPRPPARAPPRQPATHLQPVTSSRGQRPAAAAPRVDSPEAPLRGQRPGPPPEPPTPPPPDMEEKYAGIQVVVHNPPTDSTQPTAQVQELKEAEEPQHIPPDAQPPVPGPAGRGRVWLPLLRRGLTLMLFLAVASHAAAAAGPTALMQCHVPRVAPAGQGHHDPPVGQVWPPPHIDPRAWNQTGGVILAQKDPQCRTQTKMPATHKKTNHTTRAKKTVERVKKVEHRAEKKISRAERGAQKNMRKGMSSYRRGKGPVNVEAKAAELATKSSTQEYMNAEMWAQALTDPFGKGIGCRLPDGSSMCATYAFPMVLRGTLNVVNPSAVPTAAEAGLHVYPDPYYGAVWLTGEANPGDFTTTTATGAAAGQPTNLSVLTGQAALYRTVSMGVRIYSDAPIQQRGGSWWTLNNLTQQYYGGSGFSGVSASILNSAQQVLKGDLAALGGDGLRFNWLPLTDRSDFIGLNALGQLGFTAQSWRAPAWVTQSAGTIGSKFEDSALFMRFLTTTAATTGISLQYEIVWNVEAVMLAASDMSYPGRVVVGSPSAVTNVAVDLEAAGSKPISTQVAVPGAEQNAPPERGGAPHGTTAPTPITDMLTHTLAQEVSGGGMVGKVMNAGFDLLAGLALAEHKVACYAGYPELSPAWRAHGNNHEIGRGPRRRVWATSGLPEAAYTMDEWLRWFMAEKTIVDQVRAQLGVSCIGNYHEHHPAATRPENRVVIVSTRGRRGGTSLTVATQAAAEEGGLAPDASDDDDQDPAATAPTPASQIGDPVIYDDGSVARVDPEDGGVQRHVRRAAQADDHFTIVRPRAQPGRMPPPVVPSSPPAARNPSSGGKA